MTSIRLDKWLWFARFYKTRSQAAAQVTAGGVVRNGQPVDKCAQPVRVGDLLSFPQGPYRCTVQIIALGTRRGPAPEAQSLYSILSRIREMDGDPWDGDPWDGDQ